MLTLGPHPSPTHWGHWPTCLTLHHRRLISIRTPSTPWEEQPQPNLAPIVGPQTLAPREWVLAWAHGISLSQQPPPPHDTPPIPGSIPPAPWTLTLSPREPLEPLPSPSVLSPSSPLPSLSILQTSSSCDYRTNWDISVPTLTGKNCSCLRQMGLWECEWFLLDLVCK